MLAWLRSQRTGLRVFFLSILLFSLFASNSLDPVSADLPKVGLIPDGPVDDQSFNQMAYEGLLRAETEGLVDGTIYTDPDNVTAISNCVTDGNSLCITVGFMMSDATLAAAQNNPSVKFAIMDMSWDEPSYPTNLRGTYFAVDEAAYLSGTLAALMSESNQIGVVAGMDIPPINDFVIPFMYGAQWANHMVNVMINFANDFGDEALGAALANLQMDQGADVIFGVGGMMGNGAIKAAGLRSQYCIGVDVDTYFTAFGGGTVEGAEYLLTSVLKRVDNAVYQAIGDLISDTFTSGTYTYDIENEGVGLAPYHETEPNIPPEVITYLNSVAAGIGDGSIDIWEPFYTNFIYLPSILR